MVIFGGVYRGRRVFVTGHTGFKGAWLSRWLVRVGADVTGYALEPPSDPSLFQALRLQDDVRHIVADVRDHERLTGEMAKARPEVVFHLAAQPLVRESYLAPRPTFDTNVMGTVNVLEAARRSASVSAVVVVTSDKCYRNEGDGRALLEGDPLGGLDPYSSSKGCAELVTAAYAASFFAEGSCAIASARAGNVIGGGDWAADRIVPDCVRALAAGETVVVRNPEAVRPWQHVLEPLAGYLGLGESLLQGGHEFAGPWNFGPSPGDQGLTVQLGRGAIPCGMGVRLLGRRGRPVGCPRRSSGAESRQRQGQDASWVVTCVGRRQGGAAGGSLVSTLLRAARERGGSRRGGPRGI